MLCIFKAFKAKHSSRHIPNPDLSNPDLYLLKDIQNAENGSSSCWQ